jgi:hypothetical protein
MQNQFYVSHDNNNLGPWSLDEIVVRVQTQKLQVTDYLFVEEKQDWVLLMEYSPFAEKMKSQSKPKAPPKPGLPVNAPAGQSKTVTPKMEEIAKTQNVKVTNEAGDEWFVLKWDNRYGPFAYVEVIKMLQEKTIYEFDYAWKKGLEGWVRIAEMNLFSPDQIKKLKDDGGGQFNEVFFRRRHMRTAYNGTMIIHDNKKVWKGKSVEISEGGAGIVMYNAMVVPGQKLYLHFKAGDNVPSFNAHVEVVSKKYVKGLKDPNAPITYGVKFLEINKGAQKAIEQYIDSKRVGTKAA